MPINYNHISIRYFFDDFFSGKKKFFTLDKRKYEFIGNGGTRIGFKHGNVVIKIPLNQCGVADNKTEAELYKTSTQKHLLARCKLLPTNNWLVMTYVKDLIKNDIDVESWPDWVHYMDSNQAGRTISGKIVAYDYACDPELFE
jgi:hypothetical protein